jgi:acyl transferase domain-containing protein
MVFPGDELTVKIKHTVMRDGNFVVGVTTINHRGEKVLEGTAEVARPATIYAFTGQGSRGQGMGMGLYNSSPAARAVWDSADAHLISSLLWRSSAKIPRKKPSISLLSQISASARFNTGLQIALIVTSRGSLRRHAFEGFSPAERRLCWPLTGRFLCPRCCC